MEEVEDIFESVTVLSESFPNISYKYYGTDGFPYEYDFDSYSYFDYPIPLKSIPGCEIALKITITVIVMLFALTGNFLVIVVVFLNSRLKTTTNFYLVNLAVADILVTSSCTWVLVVGDLSEGWVLGSFFCKFNSFAQVVALVSSILSMTLISIDRFFGIVYALKAHIIERRARCCIIMVWVCAIIAGIPQLIYRKVFVRQWKNHVELWCDEDWVYPMTSRVTYWTTISVITFFIPSLVMLLMYGCIIKTLWGTRAPGERAKENKMLNKKITRKVIVMLVTIVAVFWLCWAPVQFSILYSEHRTNKSEIIGNWYVTFNFYARALAFSNSAVNPIIYASFSHSFRQGFRRLYNRRLRRLSVRSFNSSRRSTLVLRNSDGLKLWYP